MASTAKPISMPEASGRRPKEVPGVVEIDDTFGRMLGLADGQKVGVLLHLDPPLAHIVHVEPLTPADWESKSNPTLVIIAWLTTIASHRAPCQFPRVQPPLPSPCSTQPDLYRLTFDTSSACPSPHYTSLSHLHCQGHCQLS